MSEGSLQDNQFDLLVEEFVTRYRRGERPALTEYCARSPELADDIRRVFPTLVAMEQARPDGMDSGPVPGSPATAARLRLERLGDYRILREIARGGMGVVYEAEQESLGRHVALKVLPPQAVLDPRHLQRFQREARAAARLHHTNIVPVFGIGEHDGVYYYVMQYIPGLSLDHVLGELRQLRRPPKAELDASGNDSFVTARRVCVSAADSRSAARIAASLLRGRGATEGDACTTESNRGQQGPREDLHDAPRELDESGMAHSTAFHVRPPASDASGSGINLLTRDTTELSQPGFQYWQSVARIGVQVADAMDYAAAQGVLHRDIKPSNLLLDTHGTVWVTDFGLAKASDSDDLTHTGDVVGTLRYLAPERLRGQVDLRGDLYSLGVTLYEMLTLRSPFQDHDRSRLLRRILDEEPVRPREIDSDIPHDLETIVMKAIAKDAADRYQTSAELAGDLRQFLEDKPIAARPISQLERMWRWCRRNPRVAALTGSVAALLVAVTVISSLAAGWLKLERDMARTSERKATTAETAQRQELYRAYLSDARATYLSGRQGQRLRGLEGIRKILAAFPAGELTDDMSAELRDQAIAHLAVADLREVARLPGVSFHRGKVEIDATLDMVAASAEQGSATVIRRLSDPSFRVELAIEGPDQGQFLTSRILSPSGRWLAEYRHKPENNVDRQLVVWDWPAKKIVYQKPSVEGARLAFHPDDRQLLFEPRLGFLSIVDIVTGKIVSKSPRSFFRGRGAAFSPDGKWLAIVSPDLSAEIVDPATWETVESLPEAGQAESVAWNPVEPHVVFGTRQSRLYDWDLSVRSGRFISGDWIGVITDLSFSSDGRYLASSGSDTLFQIHGVDHDRVLVKSSSRVLGFSGDSRRVAAIVDGNNLVVLDILDSSAYTRVRLNGVEAADFSPDGNWLAIAGRNGVQLYSADSLTLKADLGLDSCGPVAFHPDGRSLVTFGMFSHAQRWPLEAPAHDPHSWGIGAPEPLVQRSGAKSPVQSLTLEPQHFGRHAAFSRDGQVLALADARNNHVLIKDSDSAASPRVFAPFPEIRRVAVSPDGQWIGAAAHGVKHTGVFRTADAQAVLEIPGHGNIAFSSDGNYFASSSVTEVQLYRVGSWQLERTIPVDRPPNWDAAPVAFQPNGRLLAVCDSYYRTRLYDRETGHNVANLTHSITETAHPYWLSFSPDGTRLAITRFMVDVGIWDLGELSAGLAELGLDVEGLPRKRQAGFASDTGVARTVTVDRGQLLVSQEHWFKFWHRLALSEALKSNWPDAIDDLNSALDQHRRPVGRDRAEILQLRGIFQLRNGNARAAREDWSEAIALAPDLSDAARNLARLHVLGPAEHRDPQRSLALISALSVAANPDPADTLIAGTAQMRLGNHEQALVTLQKADIPSAPPHAMFVIAMAKWHIGLRDDANLWFGRAVASMYQNRRADPELERLHSEAAQLLQQ